MKITCAEIFCTFSLKNSHSKYFTFIFCKYQPLIKILSVWTFLSFRKNGVGGTRFDGLILPKIRSCSTWLFMDLPRFSPFQIENWILFLGESKCIDELGWEGKGLGYGFWKLFNYQANIPNSVINFWNL